jgi:hypothetical protein
VPTWSEILLELQQLALANPQPAPGQPSPFDIVRRKYLQGVAALTHRNVILYASRWTQPSGADPDLVSIVPEDVQGFMEVVHGLTGDTLDLILHLPGGSAETTEAIVTYLRSRFNDIRVFIPQAAMSAASMLACAADRIVMGKHSFIGPIDPQFVLRTDVGVIAAPAHAILEQFKQAQQECKDPNLLPSWIPILRQYGPALLVQCQLATKLSQTLVTAWLIQYMFRGDPNAAQKADSIASALANHANFMSHGRFISRDQAKAMGLTIDNLETDQILQDAVLSVFHATTHSFGSPATKIIENHLGKSFIKLQQQQVIQFPAMMPFPPVSPFGVPPVPPAAPVPFPAPAAPIPQLPATRRRGK